MMATDISYEALNILNADYAGCIDDDLLEQWPSFFTEKCLYKITTVENYRGGMLAGLVYADSQRMLSDRVTALREAWDAALAGEPAAVRAARSPELAAALGKFG